MPDDAANPLPTNPLVAEAEAEKARAEAEKARAEAEAILLKAKAESEKARMEARLAQLQADAIEPTILEAQIKAARAGESYERDMTADRYHHRYNFSGHVDDSSVKSCIEQLNYWDRTEEPSTLEIVFYSPGGSVLAGMALFDHILAMREKGWRFVTIARGYAASMGGVLLQAGDVRAMGREAYLLIHEVSTLAAGKLGELEDEVAFCKKITERVIDIFASRSKLSRNTIRRRMSRRDWWIDSTEALKLGLVDEIR